jgi:cyclopropane-fatty-acyl-phospholipid synthase
MMQPTVKPQTIPLRPGFLDRVARRALLGTVSRLREGRLRLRDGDEQFLAGEETSQLAATVTVHHPRFYRKAAFGGSLGAAESYLDGDWSCDNLTALLQIFARNLSLSDEMDRGLARVGKFAARLLHRLRPNTRSGSRKNIHEHYDLGNDFFSLFLDKGMMYSCAYFENGDATIEEASAAKLERICRKLQLSSDDHVVEIGTGWGGFAEYAARNFGCRVTTTTISREQYEFARRRIEQVGLADRVTVIQKDFRDLQGCYDKLVSIEMIEAVGHNFLGRFFGKCGELLKNDGMMLIQGITMPEQRHRAYLRSVDFIQRYVFPGACLTSQMAMAEAAAKNTDLRVMQAEDLSPHYAETLRRWRARFFDRLDDVKRLGFPDRFLRLWEYYLCYCEAGFDERLTGLVQVTFVKPQYRGDFLPMHFGAEGATPCSHD